MVLVVGIVVDGDVAVALSAEKLGDESGGFLEVAFAICGGMVCARESLLQLVGVRCVIAPTARPAVRGTEI